MLDVHGTAERSNTGIRGQQQQAREVVKRLLGDTPPPPVGTVERLSFTVRKRVQQTSAELGQFSIGFVLCVCVCLDKRMKGT